MKKIKVIPVYKYEKLSLDNPDADTNEFPDENYKKAYEYQLKLIKAFYDKNIQKALKEVISFYKNFITFNDFANYIIYKIEEHTELTPEIKEKLLKIFEKIYKETQKSISPLETGLGIPDTKTMRFVDQMTDIYLGRFFKADQKTRLEVLNWMKNYYLKEGNPIGKGQSGVEEFLNKFGDFLKVKTENKARQIIDTTINFVRNAAAIHGYKKAKIKEFVWDAVNDRKTCSACRSMDGRVIKTEHAIQQLEEIIDRGLESRPIITTPYKGKTDESPCKFPPLHPHCHCGTYANIKEENISYFVERPSIINNYWHKVAPQQETLEAEFRNLTSNEIHYKVKAHQGSSWARMSNGRIDLEEKNLKEHFKKRSLKLGIKSIEEYKKLTEDVIKNPDEIYVQLLTNGEKDFIFKKGNFVVISNDDSLYIKSMYTLDKDTIEERIEKRANLGHGTIKIK